MKVLIISHHPVATQNNMGKTLLTLFAEFDREELCQLYIYPSMPDVDRCASFYRITDKEVLKACMLRKPGKEISRDQIRPSAGLYENPADEAIYRNQKNKSAVRRLLRDALWATSRWYNDRLKCWLDREKPDCIFVAPGQAMFLYNMALRIAKERNLPVISYICDDYYFVDRPKGGLERFRLALLKAKIRELMKKTTHLAVISQELYDGYGAEFGVPATVLMTGAGCPRAEAPKQWKHPRGICYFGNIRCNRYLALAEIGRELDRINGEQDTDYRLKLFTAEKDPQFLSCFSDISSVELCGFVKGDAFWEAFGQSRLLLHVEALGEYAVDHVRHSVSTKIADSLASGIPLLAYGPEDVSSMQHLIRNDCAITAVSRNQLRRMLLTAFSDPERSDQVVRNALATAKAYHDKTATSLKLKEIITKGSGNT